MPQKFHSLLIDADFATRQRLRQVTAHEGNFEDVQQVSTMEDAHLRLEEGGRCDVIFISKAFRDDTIRRFIKQAKRTSSGQDSAYILVLADQNRKASVLAEKMMMGADGFLFEPYSVDGLREITQIATKVRLERGAEREKMTLSLLVCEMIGKIDLLASFMRAGMEGKSVRQKIHRLKETFDRFSPEAKESCVEIAVEQLLDAPIPEEIPQREVYHGTSIMLKKRIERRMMHEVDEKIKSEYIEDDDEPEESGEDSE